MGSVTKFAVEVHGGSKAQFKSPGGRARFGGVFRVECRDREGKTRWIEDAPNLVTNGGLQHILTATFSAGPQVTTWYVGLTHSSTTPAAGDTPSSHAGWTEDTTFSEAVRQTWVEVRSNQTLTNAASKAAFSITATSVIGGAFLASINTRSGTTGTLMCVAALTGGNKSVASGDTVNVTYTFTAADDGA